MSRAKFRSSTRIVLVAVLTLLSLGSGSRLWGQTESTIYSLFPLGLSPLLGGFAADSNGALYGNSWAGGTANAGAVFQLIPPTVKGGAWTENTLYSFQGNSGGGNGGAAAVPAATPIVDSHGNVYGTTISGGEYGTGAIYELSPPSIQGGEWTETAILSESQGYFQAGLTMDSKGNMYTVSASGLVIQLVPSGSGGWFVYYLYQLPAASYTIRNLTVDKAGNVYGVSTNSGKYGYGYVFEIQPPFVAKGKWRESDLYDFTGGADGSGPMSSLTLASGVLYGTASAGGGTVYGDVFSLTPPTTKGQQWSESVLYSFQGGRDGSAPEGGVIFGGGGTLWGTTSGYNSTWPGTVYKLTPPSQSGESWTETVIHVFDGLSDGGTPMNNLLLLHGAFYGTTYNSSAAFEVMPK